MPLFLLTIADISCYCCAAFIGLEYDNPDRQEAANLLAIYSLVQGNPRSAYLACQGSMAQRNQIICVYRSNFSRSCLFIVCIYVPIKVNNVRSKLRKYNKAGATMSRRTASARPPRCRGEISSLCLQMR